MKNKHFREKNHLFHLSTVRTTASIREEIELVKRPISTLNLQANRDDFENRHLPLNLQSTRNINYGQTHQPFFPASKTSGRMKTQEDDLLDGRPTARLPLKIRNFEEKTPFEQ